MNGVLEMRKFIRQLFGIEKLEAEKARAEEAVRVAKEIEDQAVIQAAEAKLYAETAAMSPKERANLAKEPWVAVLNTHVNSENIRNGFFELDWNEYFVLQLKSAGYKGKSDEEIVDQWFSELCRNVGAEEGVNMDRRGSGFVDVTSLGNGKAEVS
jgi:hypothetical protein